MAVQPAPFGKVLGALQKIGPVMAGQASGLGQRPSQHGRRPEHGFAMGLGGLGLGSGLMGLGGLGLGSGFMGLSGIMSPLMMGGLGSLGLGLGSFGTIGLGSTGLSLPGLI